MNQPYADDSKLDPSYIHNDNRDEMNADIKEFIEKFKIMPGGQRLIESLEEGKDSGMVISNG